MMRTAVTYCFGLFAPCPGGRDRVEMGTGSPRGAGTAARIRSRLFKPVNEVTIPLTMFSLAFSAPGAVVAASAVILS